jgi:hypothetical protein
VLDGSPLLGVEILDRRGEHPFDPRGWVLAWGGFGGTVAGRKQELS